MPTVELSIKSSLYAALEQEARERNQSVQELIEIVVAGFLAMSNAATSVPQTSAETTIAAARRAKIHTEAEAWRSLPKTERRRYGSQFVAVHKGQVIDHDLDRLQLYRRVRQQFGNTPILITPADEPHPREFRILSPRLGEGSR